jgi:hypothetical protein
MTTFLLISNSWKKLQKIHSKKAINKSDGKIEFLTIITVWKVFVLQLFGMNHFSFFRRSKYASNFAFYNTHIEILLHKIVLLLFANFEAKRGLNSSKKLYTYFINVFYIAFLFAWNQIWEHSFYQKGQNCCIFHISEHVESIHPWLPRDGK